MREVLFQTEGGKINLEGFLFYFGTQSKLKDCTRMERFLSVAFPYFCLNFIQTNKSRSKWLLNPTISVAVVNGFVPLFVYQSPEDASTVLLQYQSSHWLLAPTTSCPRRLVPAVALFNFTPFRIGYLTYSQSIKYRLKE